MKAVDSLILALADIFGHQRLQAGVASTLSFLVSTLIRLALMLVILVILSAA